MVISETIAIVEKDMRKRKTVQMCVKNILLYKRGESYMSSLIKSIFVFMEKGGIQLGIKLSFLLCLQGYLQLW